MIDLKDQFSYLDKTRLVEEVPGVDEGDRYFLWLNHKVEAKFATKAEGERYCAERGITVDQFEPFEP